MKEKFNIIVVIPVGPNTNIDFLKDTIESINYYLETIFKIVLCDDSQQGLGNHIQKFFPEINVYTTVKSSGVFGGLYITLSEVYKYILLQYKFDFILKMDTDALMIGKNPQIETQAFFNQNSKVGMAGLYSSGLKSTDFFGNEIDNSWVRNQLIKETCTFNLLRRPLANWALRKVFLKAIKNGYEVGENVFGGAYFLTPACLIKLKEAGFLPLNNLKKVILGEDHIFSILIKIVGLNLGDLASGNLPFACGWNVLPAPPEILLEKSKKIIHSTRNFRDLREKEIRNFFKRHRV